MFEKLSLFFILIYKINCQTTLYIPPTTPSIVYNDCPFSGFSQYVTLDNKTCYYYATSYEERLTWHDANEACQRQGAQLLSIHDRITNQLFANLGRELSPSYTRMQYWIGLNALEHRNIYKWSDGSVYNYANYPYTGAPSGIPTLPTYDYYTQGRCNYYWRYAFYKSENQYNDNYGYWYFDYCNNVHQYICAKSLDTTALPPTTTLTPKGNCPQGWYQFDDKKCIKLMNASLTHDKALKLCVETQSGELLNIHTAKEQYYITALLAGKPSPFIGINRPQNTYSWTWSDQSNLSYANWGEETEDNYLLKCGVISTTNEKSGKWIPTDCDSAHPYICERPKDASITTVPPKAFGNCTIFAGMSNFVQYRNSCYYVNDVLDTWDNAVGYCQRMSESHLVSIQNGFEYSFLMYYTLEYSKNSNHWIGFFSTAVNGVNTPQAFEWIDTSPNYYSHWDDNEPAVNPNGTKKCVYQTNTNGTWKTSDCNQKRAYICKKTLDKVPEVNYTLGICPDINSTEPKESWLDLDKRSKYCYWFSMVLDLYDVVAWSGASFHCRQRNGSLATIHSDHDLAILKSSISSAMYNTWIGLYQQPGGAYGWDDGSAVDFTNWDTSDDDDLIDTSDDMCVEIRASDLKWHKTRCTQYAYKYYVCQIPKIFNTSVSLPLSTTTGPKSNDFSNGAKAGIIISVILAVSIIGVSVFYAIRKYKINISSSTSFDNSMYSNNRAHSSTANNNSENDEPKITFRK